MSFERIVWTPEMSVGCDVLDDDHKLLISCLNDFVEACENDEGVFVIDPIFRVLMHYTEFHFEREEQIIEACGFPELEHHRQVHTDMTEKVHEAREQFMMTPSKMLEDDVKTFLLSWLQEHILEEDMGYREYMRDNQETVTRILAEMDTN
ncbi:MAG: bacteriohemerythrin [Magnetovibrionaceae bacterium]